MNSFTQLHTDQRQWTRAFSTSKHGVRQDAPQADWIHGSQQNDLVNAALQQPKWYNETIKVGSIAEAVYRMFSPGYFSSWEAFASTLYIEQNSAATNFLSLEYIHNNIHVSFSRPEVQIGLLRLSAYHMF